MKRIYHWFTGLFKRKRRLTMAEFERMMPPDTRALIEKEVAFLRNHHVSVRPLAQAEEAQKPMPANPADEDRLPPLNAQD